MFISELLSLFLVIFIGIRSLNGISETTKSNTSAFCVFLIWLNELVIISRYVLSISSNNRTGLDHTDSETPSQIVVPSQNVTTTEYNRENLDRASMEVHKLEGSIDMDHRFEVYEPTEFNNNRLKLNTSEIANEDHVSMKSIIKLTPLEIDGKIDKASKVIQKSDSNTSALNTYAANTVLSSSRILQNSSRRVDLNSVVVKNYLNPDANATHTENNYSRNSEFSRAEVQRPPEPLSTIVEEIKIQEFLEKSKKINVNFGNMGLGFK